MLASTGSIFSYAVLFPLTQYVNVCIYKERQRERETESKREREREVLCSLKIIHLWNNMHLQLARLSKLLL